MKVMPHVVENTASVIKDMLSLIQHAIADDTRSDTARVHLVIECESVSSKLFRWCVDPYGSSSRTSPGMSVVNMVIYGHEDKANALSLAERVNAIGGTSFYFHDLVVEKINEAEIHHEVKKKALSPLVPLIISAIDLDHFTDPETTLRVGNSVIELISRIITRYANNQESFQHKDQWIADLVSRKVISVAEAVCLYYMAHNRNSHHPELFSALIQDILWIPQQWQKDQYIRCWLYTMLNHPGKTMDHRVYLHHVEEEGEDFQGVPEPIVATMMMSKRKRHIDPEEHENVNTVLRTYASITVD